MKRKGAYPITRGGRVKGFRQRGSKSSKTPSRKVVVKTSPIVGTPKIEWYEKSWLDIKVKFPEGEGDVKAQRGYDPRDFSMIYEPHNPDYKTMFLEEIGVSPEGRGYGTILYRIFEKEAKKHGVEELTGEVVEDAVPFLKKMGWHPNTVPETWEDTNWGRALRMYKDLTKE